MKAELSPLNVLLVEDSESDAALLEAELRRAGFAPSCHRIQTASALATALESGSWDLVIADYVMPNFDGLSALALVRKLGLDLPFIVVSGLITDDTAVAAMKAGAHDYLMKDNLARLGSAVRRELHEAEVRRDRRQAEDRLRAEHAITRLLAVAEDINEAADGVLKILMESLDLDAGIFWQLDASRQVLRAASVRLRPGREYLAKFARRRRSAPLAKGEELAGRAWRELLPVCILVEPGPTEVSEVGGMPTRSGLAFPIQSGGTAHGALEFWSHRSLHLNTPVLNMLSAIGSELGQFIQRRDAQAALRRAHDELEVRVQRRTAELQLANSDLEASIVERKRLEQELLEITEKERRRIGLDLHDDLGQKLSGIALMAKGLELRLTQCHSAEAQRARKIQELVQQTMNHTSDLAHDLAALDFGEKNLRAALRHLAVRVAELFGIRCRFQAEGRPAFLDAPSARQISKIAQEAVTNAIKHGKAQDVEIQLVTGQKELTLTVKNDGLPFPDLEGCRAGMGVRIMNYRAHLLNGTLEIRAPAGVGTILECRIPLASRSPRSNRRARATHPKTRRIL